MYLNLYKTSIQLQKFIGDLVKLNMFKSNYLKNLGMLRLT